MIPAPPRQLFPAKAAIRRGIPSPQSRRVGRRVSHPAVAGMGKEFTGLTSVVFVIFTDFCSLTFELAVAREEEAADGRLKPE